MSSSPRIEASVQNALSGWAKDQPAPKAKMMPITMCSQRQPERTEAMKNSLIMATRNRTPSKAPTVGTDAG